MDKSKITEFALQVLKNSETIYSKIKGKSMLPTIAEGDLVGFNPIPNDIKYNDIIVFKRNETIITHRVIALRRNETGKFLLLTKGDNNFYPDLYWLNPAVKKDIVGKVVEVAGQQINANRGEKNNLFRVINYHLWRIFAVIYLWLYELLS